MVLGSEGMRVLTDIVPVVLSAQLALDPAAVLARVDPGLMPPGVP
jgi:hypothetical protein